VSRAFAWHERGTGLELHAEPGLVRVELLDDGERHSAEFAPAVVEALVEQLDGHDECVPADDLADVEAERDKALERAKTAESSLRAALADLETAKTALALADDRQRAAEAEQAERHEQTERALARLRVIEARP
jgi:hypothetical protein